MIDDQLLQQAIELATSRDQLQRRNERERNRVNRVNIAFENLRSKKWVLNKFTKPRKMMGQIPNINRW